MVSGSALRPHGVPYIPWARGKCLAWDFTSPDKLAPSHLPATCSLGGAAASRASDIKFRKYQPLNSSHLFVPVAVESLGPWNGEGLAFVKDLGRRISEVAGNPRESSFLFQRISVAIQVDNSIAVSRALPHNSEASVGL